MAIDYEVIVHEDPECFWASIPELPGCFAASDTREELTEAVIEAIAMYNEAV